MAKNLRDQRNQERDERRELSRRSLIKWTVAGAAALGLPRWKAFEILGASSGLALADTAACAPTNRSVHIIAGNGGFAWFQLLWPHNDVAAANSATFAFHAPGQQVMATGTDKPFTLGPQAPFKTIDGKKQMTAFLGGTNETHTQTPSSSSVIATGTSVFAAVAAMQATNPTLVPVIAIDNAPFGTAAGAPRVARVPTPADIVGLFNSAASRTGGVLEQMADASLYDASLKAMLGLQAAAATPTTNRSYGTVKSASRLLGTNLASQLMVTSTDLASYGVTGTTSTKLSDFARTLIITAKAFSLGLTSSVILPAFRDDPHGAFNDMATLVTTVTTMGKVLDAFYADLMARDDATCAGTKIGDNVVMSIHGDTPKTPLSRNGWPDGTPSNSNWSYVFGNGLLKTGWFGGIARDGTVAGWDPTTGGASTMTSAQLAMPAAAAIAYAVSGGDIRRVNDFYRGVAIDGVVRLRTM
jgi:hypothetical protein